MPDLGSDARERPSAKRLSPLSLLPRTDEVVDGSGEEIAECEDSDDAFALGVRRVDGAAIIVFFALPPSQNFFVRKAGGAISRQLVWFFVNR